MNIVTFLWCWCITLLSTIFQLKRSGTIYWWTTPEYPEKSIDLVQVTDKLFHIKLYIVQLAISWIRTHNFSSDMHVLNRKM